MALLRRDPLQDIRTLARRMEQAFEPLMPFTGTFEREPLMAQTFPPVDVYEDREEIVLRAEVPGMEQKEIEILLEDSTLTLKGERKLYREDKKENYQRIESNVGVFTRSFAMPAVIDRDKIRADLHNGVLEVHVPKKEGAKAKTIPVNV
ncbi:MAG: Hsp20/alpha crystallin family protein [Myxococcaceae bacterium]